MSNPFDPHDAELRRKCETDRHFADLYGSDLNPFSTSGARLAWQQGWDNEPSHRLPEWQRGRMARLIHDEGQV